MTKQHSGRASSNTRSGTSRSGHTAFVPLSQSLDAAPLQLHAFPFCAGVAEPPSHALYCEVEELASTVTAVCTTETIRVVNAPAFGAPPSRRLASGLLSGVHRCRPQTSDSTKQMNRIDVRF